MYFALICTNFIQFWFNKIKSFQSSEITKNDYIIRVVGSTIDLERFYGNSDTKTTINELIKISKPDQMLKQFFCGPRG